MTSNSRHIVHSMNKICGSYSSCKCLNFHKNKHLYYSVNDFVLFFSFFFFVYFIRYVLVFNKTHQAVCLNIWFILWSRQQDYIYILWAFFLLFYSPFWFLIDENNQQIHHDGNSNKYQGFISYIFSFLFK